MNLLLKITYENSFENEVKLIDSQATAQKMFIEETGLILWNYITATVVENGFDSNQRFIIFDCGGIKVFLCWVSNINKRSKFLLDLNKPGDLIERRLDYIQDLFDEEGIDWAEENLITRQANGVKLTYVSDESKGGDYLGIEIEKL